SFSRDWSSDVCSSDLDRDDPVFSGIRLNTARDDELLHIDVKLLKAGELADAHPGVDQDQDGPSPHITRFGQLGDRAYFQIGEGRSEERRVGKDVTSRL